MHIYNWNDGPIDQSYYCQLDYRIVFVVDSPHLNRNHLMTQSEPIQLHTPNFTWALPVDELANWLCLLYSSNTLSPKAYQANCLSSSKNQGTNSLAADTSKNRLLTKFNFIKIYDETLSSDFLPPGDLSRLLQDRALQSHLRQAILEFRPALVVYLGCSWVHNEILYKNKWNHSTDEIAPHLLLKHHNEMAFIGYQPEQVSHEKNYMLLKDLICKAQEKLSAFRQEIG